MALAEHSHPVYPLIPGHPLYERCVCGGIVKFHGDFGCDDCSCQGFRPENGLRRREPTARVPSLVAELTPKIKELLSLHGGDAAWGRLICAAEGICPSCGGRCELDASCMCQRVAVGQ